ncbi:PREDICTED: sorting nexin-12 isoform X2 [Hipposideros armiger]|uniref:Sorting nexin-12 isoform X2 n=1 Tax=Hipposideros armiger TaxID=186990 RepID=A0A8B7RRH8_HIPAR|nr:PREDICTED: sorting nexin-12 isoform X2 [Hipposideros armiger]
MQAPGRPQAPPGSLNEASWHGTPSRQRGRYTGCWARSRGAVRARACVRGRACAAPQSVGWLAILQAGGVARVPASGLCPPTPPFPGPGLGLSFGKMSDTAVADTRRLNSKPQDLTDAYGPPSNFLEIDIFNPQTVGVGRARFTTYETNLPIFKLKESCVRRRYSDFEWLKNELERDSKIVVPPLPGKALKRQLPFRGDEGIFEESFIEERRQGLEQFINKIAGHPLAQNERCLHMFLQEEAIDRSYVPGKVTKAVSKRRQEAAVTRKAYLPLGNVLVDPRFQTSVLLVTLHFMRTYLRQEILKWEEVHYD